MKRRFFTTALRSCLAAVVFSLASCRTVDSGERGFCELAAEKRESMAADAERFGNGILRAFRDEDFAAFKRCAPGEMSSRITEADFAASCRAFREKFGEIRDFRLLTALDTPAFGNLIWVVTFIRKGTNDSEIRRQLLFRLIAMQTDGKTVVVSCGFL